MASYSYANLGDEFLVNTTTAGTQEIPRVAALAGGGFVMVWQSFNAAGNDLDVRAQLYDADSNKVGAEFLVNTVTTGLQGLASVVSLASGGFVVGWTDNSGGTNDIRGQIFDAAGAKVGAAFLVNTDTAGSQILSSFGALPSGGFVATWRTASSDSVETFDVEGQIFDAAGNKVGGEFAIPASNNFQQTDVVVTMLASGRFVATWTEATGVSQPFVTPANVKGQIFEANGTKIGGEFTVNPVTIDSQARPAIAALAGGGFVVTWQDIAGSVNDPSEYGIRAQLYSAVGVKVGSDFAVNTTSANTQELPRITPLASGGFVISWSDETGDGSGAGIKAQVFDANGAMRGGEFLVNTTTTGSQLFSTLTELASGRLVIAWDDPSGIGGDPGTGIKAQLIALYRSATIAGTANADTIAGTGGNDAIEGLAGNDVLDALGGDDILIGAAGNDRLTGGAGIDRTEGGAGDDFHSVDNARDNVVELVGEGNDFVAASVDYRLAAGVEIETLSSHFHAGTAAINLTGNEFGQDIYGNNGANRIDGGAGADTLYGFAGDDFYLVDNARDGVIERAGEGNDIVAASIDYQLAAGMAIETLTSHFHAGTASINLTGNEFGQDIYGNAGANRLDGGAGGDTLYGFLGNDFYLVDNSRDGVVERVGEGNDIVAASVDFQLAAGQEIETLTSHFHAGTAVINLTGNEFAQDIYGNNGANRLDGGGGADTLYGFLGDDFYLVDNSRDGVVERVGEGNDIVAASVDFQLAAGQEIETLTSHFHAGTAAINLTGNELRQDIYGNAGANRIDGGGGADTLYGFGGNDFYIVGHAGAGVVEQIGEGNDFVAASVSYQLAAGQEVETLSTFGHAGTTAINLTGNAFAQDMYGNAGVNTLDGKGGNDRLTGFAGADIYAFTTALSAANNLDQIVEFVTGSDRIALDDAIFAGLGQGTLPSAAFRVGAAAADADDRIIYNQATGGLFFDADGNGASAAIQFATLLNQPAGLAASDFVVI